MRKLEALTPEQLASVEERLRNPPPGSEIEAARDFGVDLMLMLESLRLSPAQRAARMLEACETAEALRGLARKAQ